MVKPPAFTQSELHALLAYDPETGVFTWQNSRGNQVARAGAVAGHTNAKGRRMIEIHGRAYTAARLAWFYATGDWPDLQVDHKDADRMNDRWLNLRLATNRVNKQNARQARADSSTGVMGVSRQGARFRAKIKTPDGRRLHLGMFASSEEASAAYLSAKRLYHEGCTL